jgi:hypothetical protein
MANNFIQNPIVVDTVIASKVSAQAGVSTSIPNGGWTIDHIRWVNPSAPADTFLITLGDGTTKVLQDYCVAANQSVEYPMYGLKLNDFQVPTLASGTLYIYFR